MPLFSSNSVTLAYSNVDSAKQWWISAFDCTEEKVPAEWDNQLPSDVALKFPGFDEPTILLNDLAEVRAAGFERTSTVPIVFCGKLKKAHEHLSAKGVGPGPIQDDGETQFFEIRDLEGNVIEICKEP